MTKSINYKERQQFYELEYNTTVDYEFVLSMITDKVSSVLEIPCAVGRLTFEIAKKGRNVVAADIEPAMIEKMQERLKSHPLKSYINPRVADMRDFNFDEKFDLILIPQEAFQLLIGSEDAIKALINMKRHLNPRGKIMVDLFPFQQIGINDLKKPEHIAALPGYYDFNQPDDVMIFDWTKEIEPNETLHRFHSQQHLSGGIIQITYRFQKQNRTGSSEDMTMIINLQNYSVETFADICAEADLDIKHIYGDYSKKPYEPLDPRMIFILGLK